MYGGRGAWVRASGAVMGVALLLAGCSGGDDGGGDGDGGGGRKRASGSGITQQPRGTGPFWVNPKGNAAAQVTAYEQAGKDENAELIRRIAEQPTGEWIGPENPEREARGFTVAAERADRDAVLVLYNIPHRDCGQYSGGGAADGDTYRAWIDGVVRGIGDRPATIVLEPDAVLHVVDGCTPGQFHEERYDLLRGAIEKLGALKNTKVYLDAGNAGWGDPEEIYDPLKWAGVEQADGFAVNVSNFYTTADSIAYGKQLSSKIGDKPFVIDTSRNGNGAPADGQWCDPAGRKIGQEPTLNTGQARIDAYLWVKLPGESDGCKGTPGTFSPSYAYDLAR